MDTIEVRLQNIERLLKAQHLSLKTVLSFAEACTYLELSDSHLYKLTSTGGIPHYKPNGKKIYFQRTELDAWLLRNRTATSAELEASAAGFITKPGRAKS